MEQPFLFFFIPLNSEMEIYHLKWTSCSGLSFKFVFHYLFGNIAGGQLHWQPHRPQDSEGPLRARFEAVVPENGHEEAAFLHAPFCLRGQQAPSWKSSVLGCKLEWNVPGDTPKGLFFVTSPRFSFLPRIILMPSICSAVGAFVCGAGTERKLWPEVGTPPPVDEETRWLSKPLLPLSIEQSGGAESLILLKLGLVWSGYCGFISRGLGTARPRRGSFAGASSTASSSPFPSGLRTRAAQAPWMWLQPSSHSLRGIFETFLISVCFLL